MSFSVQVDSVQIRNDPQYPAVSTLVSAPDWDLASSSDTVFQDGVTGSIWLIPGCFEAGWLTQNTGIFAKLPFSSFTPTPAYSAGPPPNWQTPTLNTDNAQWYKYPNNTSGCSVVTTSAQAANQPMVIEYSNNRTSGSVGYLFAYGWSNTGDLTAGIGGQVYNDGSQDIWIDGVFVGHYSISGQIAPYGQTYGLVPAQGALPYVLMAVIPCRERELLVLTNLGGGFSHICANIAEGTTNPIITPAEKFWMTVEQGVDLTFRIALCQFETSGNAIGKLSYFATDPGSSPPGGFQTFLDGNSIENCSVQVSDGSNPSNPYVSATDGVRMNVALSAPSSGPPELPLTVYGTRGYTLPQTSNTIGPPLDVTEYLLSLDYESGDSIAGTRWSATFKDPQGIEAAGNTLSSANKPGALFESVSERPFQIYDGGAQVLEGLNESPKYERSIIVSSSTGDPVYTDNNSNAAENVKMQFRDTYLFAENRLLKEMIPLDTLTFPQAYQLFSDGCGITNQTAGNNPLISSSLSSFTIPSAGNPTQTYNVMAMPGDRFSDWLDRLVKTYCANYMHRMVPMNGWNQPQVLSAADLGSTPVLMLYDSYDTASAMGVSDPTYLNYFRTLDVQMLKPEANDIYVLGHDYRSGRPILANQMDTVNSSPNVKPADRTPAWRGMPIEYSWVDPMLTDIGVVQYVLGLLYDRLTIARSMIEFESDFFGLKRGDVVKLCFRSGGGIQNPAVAGTSLLNPVTARIKTVNANFKQLAVDGKASKWRPTRYIAQVPVDDASNLDTRSTNLRGVESEWAVRTKSKRVIWGDATTGQIWIRPLIDQYQA